MSYDQNNERPPLGDNSALSVMAMWALAAPYYPPHWPMGPRRKSVKPSKQCALPGCNHQTRHNGGYCCADHCREHRRTAENKPLTTPPEKNHGQGLTTAAGCGIREAQ